MAKANYDLPEDVLLKVCKVSKAKSKKAGIIIALEDYLKRKKIKELLDHEGKINLNWTKSDLRKYRE